MPCKGRDVQAEPNEHFVAFRLKGRILALIYFEYFD
jgi:hypothetical protein